LFVIRVTYFAKLTDNVVSFASLEDRPFALLEDRPEPCQDEFVPSAERRK
jgi:hypothetical protein